TVVKRDRQAADLVERCQEQQIDQGRDGGRRRCAGARGERFGGRSHGEAQAGRQQATEQTDAPQERAETRLAFEPVIAGGSILVHATQDSVRPRMRMPPFVVFNSIGVPPPFIRPSNRRRDCSDTSILSPDARLMPPLVQVAVRSAFAVSGRSSVTPPLVVLSWILSAPSAARSTFTPPLVVRASPPPANSLAFTPPLVVCALTLPLSALSVIGPLVDRA